MTGERRDARRAAYQSALVSRRAKWQSTEPDASSVEPVAKRSLYGSSPLPSVNVRMPRAGADRAISIKVMSPGE